MADDMREGAQDRFPVVAEQSQFFVPDVPSGAVAWWVTTGHAARLVVAGLVLNLDVVDAAWLAAIPFEHTNRRTWVGVLEGLAAGEFSRWEGADPGSPTAGFIKPALAKVDCLPAAWTDDVAGTAAAALADGAHPKTSVQATATRLDLLSEHRVFVLDGAAVTSSPYLIDGVAWEPGCDASSRPAETAAARSLAEAVVASTPSPDALVVDVGLTRSGRWVVVEGNAPWSANPYGCDLSAVVDCVVASTCGRPRSRWTWRPDPHEAAVAAGMEPLALRN